MSTTMSPLRKLEASQSLTEQAHARIKRYILAKTPGAEARMTETFFAERLGISKSPVREALNSLQSEGLLRIEPRRGAFVHRFTAKEIADLYGLREAVETFAAELVPVTPKLIKELRASVRRTKELLGRNDKAGYIDEDIYFHHLIVQSTGNAELVRVHGNLQEKLWLCRCQTYQLTSSDTVSAHRAIAEALATDDRIAAKSATQNHIRFVRTVLTQACDEQTRQLRMSELVAAEPL